MSTAANPETAVTVLAKSGDGGFECHRIPALTQATNGWILAAWDGRPGGCADAPNPNSVVQRISKDAGRTWQPLQVIAAGSPGSEKWGYSDPSYVTDRETGTVFLFCVKSFDAGFFHSQAGTDPQAKDVLHAVVMHSDDHGQTWSNPRDITADITADPTTWTSRFATSGEGIQLRYGPQRGRLLQQYAVRIGAEIKALTVYSDDHGQTWQAGEPFGENMDENKVVELSDGTVMVNSRSSAPGETYRKVAYSHDGGHTYGPAQAVPELVDPRNNATLMRAYPNAPEGSAEAKILLFANTFSPERRNGTVHVSYDDGHTWARRRTFHLGEMQYCTLTALDTPGKYALAYEAPLSSIVYRQISREWIENNEDGS